MQSLFLFLEVMFPGCSTPCAPCLDLALRNLFTQYILDQDSLEQQGQPVPPSKPSSRRTSLAILIPLPVPELPLLPEPSTAWSIPVAICVTVGQTAACKVLAHSSACCPKPVQGLAHSELNKLLVDRIKQKVLYSYMERLK